jgi:hypothetical protein
MEFVCKYMLSTDDCILCSLFHYGLKEVYVNKIFQSSSSVGPVKGMGCASYMTKTLNRNMMENQNVLVPSSCMGVFLGAIMGSWVHVLYCLRQADK